MPSAPQTTHSHLRNQNLDALRGLAATLVLVTHASENYAPVAQNNGYSTWLADAALSIDIGRIGVVLFFLISGFAVANSLRQTENGIGGFAIRRIFRLYPMFWFSAVVAVVFLEQSRSLDFATKLANLTMLPELLGFSQMLGIYWTLETEVISYVLAVLLVVSGKYNSGRFLGTMCVGLVVVFALMMFGVLPTARLLQWQMLPHNLAIILWGSLFHLGFGAPAAVAKMQRPGWPSLRVATMLLAPLVLSPSFYMLLQYALHGSADYLRWGTAYPVAFTLFIWAFFRANPMPRWLVRLGQISYSSYLLHLFVITLVSQLLQESNLMLQWVSLPLFVALVLLFTTALANLSFWAIEKPAMQWGKRLEQRYRKQLKMKSTQFY